jgi:hypothetical protein
MLITIFENTNEGNTPVNNIFSLQNAFLFTIPSPSQSDTNIQYIKWIYVRKLILRWGWRWEGPLRTPTHTLTPP